MTRTRMSRDEAWAIFWEAAGETSARIKDPIALLATRGCGRSTAIALMRELDQTQIVLLHCAKRSWDSITALTIKKGLPPKPVSAAEISKAVLVKAAQDRKEDQKLFSTSAPNGPTTPHTPTRSGRVVMLVDRDNIMIPLQRGLHRPFPFQQIFEYVARIGGLEAAFLFTPLFERTVPSLDHMHAFERWKTGWEEWHDELLLFSRHGYELVFARSAKSQGGDRVDEALRDMGHLLLKDINISTLLIFSEDRDFSKLYAHAAGNGKKVLQFRVDVVRGVLRSTEYLDEIPIPEKQGNGGLVALTTRPRTAWQAAATS